MNFPRRTKEKTCIHVNVLSSLDLNAPRSSAPRYMHDLQHQFTSQCSLHMRFVKSIDAFHDMTCSLGQSGIYLYSILVQSCTRAECASGQLNSVVCDTAVQ